MNAQHADRNSYYIIGRETTKSFPCLSHFLFVGESKSSVHTPMSRRHDDEHATGTRFVRPARATKMFHIQIGQ